MALDSDPESPSAVLATTSLVFRHRFKFLLISLFAFLLSLPIVQHVTKREGSQIPDIVILVVFALIMLSAVNAISAGRRCLWIGSVLAAAAVLCRITFFLYPSGSVRGVGQTLGVAFLVLVCMRLIKHVLDTRQVTAETVYASLCAYLMFGLAWGMLFSVLDLLIPNSFGVPMNADGRDALTPFYFSFVTLTTLGYGDISPVKPMARILCVIEAVVGQLYLVVLVARLVSLHIANRDEVET